MDDRHRNDPRNQNDGTPKESPSEHDLSERERQLAAETGRINPATHDGRGINPNEAGRGLPMTDHQRERLKILSEEAAVPVEENLTYDEAEQKIDELQVRAGLKPE
jgi:Protein of unknown function (DUF3072).